MADTIPLSASTENESIREALSYIEQYSGIGLTCRLLHVYETHDNQTLVQAAGAKLLSICLSRRWHFLLRRLCDSWQGRCQASFPASDAALLEAEKESADIMKGLYATLAEYQKIGVRESLRFGHVDIAEYALLCGDTQTASRHIMEASSFCSSAGHYLRLTLMVFKLFMITRSQDYLWQVSRQLQKIHAFPEMDEWHEAVLAMTVACKFIYESSFEEEVVATILEPSFSPTLAQDEPEYFIPSDYALLFTLCMLAKWEKAKILNEMIESSRLRQFMEIEPLARRLLRTFEDVDLKQFWLLLEQADQRMHLCLFMSMVRETLIGKVKSRVLAGYIGCFSRIALDEVIESAGVMEADVKEAAAVAGYQAADNGRILEPQEANLAAEIRRHIDESKECYEKIKARVARQRSVD